MGALLQRIGWQGMPSQSLVQAPSADLIKSDNELVPPESEDIQLEIELEKLESYATIANTHGFAKQTIDHEVLLHLLKSKNFKVFDRSKVNDFMGRYIVHTHQNLKLGDDLWWRWIDLKKYRHPLPHRVVNNIKIIHSESPLRSSYSFGKDIVFFVSDVVLVTYRSNGSFYKNKDMVANDRWEVIPMKRKTEICFIKIASDANTLSEESLIIDAWRGPTFSDEEAKI